MTPLRCQRVEHDSPLGRWTFCAARATGLLAETVELFWTLEARDAYSRERILPRSSTELMFNLGEPAFLHGNGGETRRFAASWVAGLQQRPLDIESHPNARMAAIRFRPGGVLAFLGVPPSELTDRVVELTDVFGSGAHELRERLASERSPESRLALLARAVERRLASGRPPRPEVRRALSAIGGSRGQVAVRDLVADSGFSHRAFSRRFQEEVGLRPKVFTRVVRFETAVARLDRPPESWSEFALDSGYFDQAHMIREFRELAGATPTQVARRLAPDGLGLLDE